MSNTWSLFQDIAVGLEASNNILIEDSIHQNGRHLMKGLLPKLFSRYNIVHVTLTDISETVWPQGLSDDVQKKLVLHSWETDPAGWNNSESCSLAEVLSLDSFSFSTTESEATLIIDTLSTLLLHYHYTEICRLIHKLGSLYSTVYYLLHYDLHDDHVIKALHHMMSSIVRVEPRNPDLITTHHHHHHHTGICSIVHKRRTGKILKEREMYYISEKWETFFERISPQSMSKIKVNNEPDPTAHLTFNLSLTDREKRERSHVVLPYTQISQKQISAVVGGGQVTYQLDEVDDWDESDPDDDLNI